MMRGPLLAGAVALGLLAARRRRVAQVLRVSRTVADLDRAEAFYTEALGFRRVSAGPCGAGLSALLGLPGAQANQVVMRLGTEEVALVRFTPAGAPYPAASRGNDQWFQHLAVVVGTMAEAHDHVLALAPGTVSEGGPVTLPARNGGVRAWKFRDPDGHPLELIHFPAGVGRTAWRVRPGLFLGIDHSALVVRDTRRSWRFYRRLGFRVGSRSDNFGEAQARLDGVADAHARVTGLRPGNGGSAGLELLCYVPPGRPTLPWPANDAVTDWTTLLVPGLRAPRMLRDPDGHRMLLVGEAELPA